MTITEELRTLAISKALGPIIQEILTRAADEIERLTRSLADDANTIQDHRPNPPPFRPGSDV
jgi:hypothetical protein